MPKIRCEHGHEQSIGTDEWVKQLTIDQMKYARDKMDALIKKAADHLIRIFKEKFMKEAADFIAEPYGYMRFQDELPRISVERFSQLEYETEWFPGAKPREAP